MSELIQLTEIELVSGGGNKCPPSKPPSGGTPSSGTNTTTNTATINQRALAFNAFTLVGFAVASNSATVTQS